MNGNVTASAKFSFAFNCFAAFIDLNLLTGKFKKLNKVQTTE